MLRDRPDAEGRRYPRPLRFLILVFVLGALSACTAAAGGGIVAVLVGVGALTSHCYDYLDVTVFDEQGRKTCAPTVTASRNKSSEHFELESCYYAPLSDGRWTLRASTPGRPDVETVVDVEHESDCTRHVQSVELTLNTVGPVPALATPALATPAPTATPAISASTAAPAPVTTSLPPSPTPATSSALPNAAAVPSAPAGSPSTSAPSSGGSSSVGVFPPPSESSP